MDRLQNLRKILFIIGLVYYLLVDFLEKSLSLKSDPFVLKPKKVDACKDKGVKINNGYGTRQIFAVTSG